MIVGNGLLAGAFTAYAANAAVVIFASGVSNSGEKDPRPFERERTLLSDTLATDPKLLVYFSTCSIYDPALRDSAYIRHKLQMEALIRGHGGDYLILRLPQVVGPGGNPNTITNFIRDRLISGEPFTVWANASRTLIDVDDVRALADHFIAGAGSVNRTVNIFPPIQVSALDLVATMERILEVRGTYTVADAGSSVALDEPDIMHAASASGVSFGPDYTEQVLRKYYGRR